MERAPYFDEVAKGPAHSEAYWLDTADGVRIRACLWPLEDAKGTVFLLPGRTECIEKYANGAKDLAERGYASLAIDWRGQGLADRALKDPQIGHVEDFADYLRDLDAVIGLAKAKAMPEPWFLMGHSMGGCIGLRALAQDHPFNAAGFSGPMWGIGLTGLQKALVRFIAPVIAFFGLSHLRAAGTKRATYMLWHDFEDNLLTSDRQMWDHMRDQVIAHPELGLGGPSTKWVTEALRETEALDTLPSPEIPAICFLGTDEKIVNNDTVRKRMARWPDAELIPVKGGRHETPMETDATRAMFYDRLVALFDAAQG
ncbi:alpha/beta hydrolase [Celeribacter arenosi]|uniref:Alpha/beta hydrolase n=1 Tax=Celeribacter arenosi TaxID=792649 RepID=A0ABP7JT93_9RHOB